MIRGGRRCHRGAGQAKACTTNEGGQAKSLHWWNKRAPACQPAVGLPIVFPLEFAKRLLRSDWFLRLWTLAFGVLPPSPHWRKPRPNAPPPTLPRPGTHPFGHLNETQRAFIAENRSLLTFGLDHAEFPKPRLSIRPLWQYLATFLYIPIAFQVARFVDWLIHTRLRKTGGANGDGMGRHRARSRGWAGEGDRVCDPAEHRPAAL